MRPILPALLAVPLLLLAACGPSEAPPAKPNVDVTPMRGVIEKLPTAEAPRKLMIRHEATKDMGAMSMPFEVEEGGLPANLAVGDKVSFQYVVDWTKRTERVTKMEKLPSDTVLNLGMPAASAPAAHTMQH